HRLQQHLKPTLHVAMPQYVIPCSAPRGGCPANAVTASSSWGTSPRAASGVNSVAPASVIGSLPASASCPAAGAVPASAPDTAGATIRGATTTSGSSLSPCPEPCAVRVCSFGEGSSPGALPARAPRCGTWPPL